MDYSEDWQNFDQDLLELDIEEFLEQDQERERERLEQELERVTDLLEERRELHQEAINELESKLDWYLNRLETAYTRQRPQKKVDRLKEKVEDFYSAIRREKHEKWRDRIELEMEVREIERSLAELEDIEGISELL